MAKPVFGTKEWATSNVNILYGCQHDCKYCYAKAMFPRQGRKIEDWKNPTLRKKKGYGKRKGRIMFPTTHDLHPDNLDDVLVTLEKLLKPGNDLLIVSKPHFECIRAICDKCSPYKDHILFRFTIGSADNKRLSLWEPNAPTFEERLQCLKHAYEGGYSTSVSCEPMLDESITAVINMARLYVTDAIWLGKANFLMERLKMNGYGNDKKMMDIAAMLLISQSDEHIKELYELYKTDPIIKWKESIKKVVGIEVPTELGLDI